MDPELWEEVRIMAIRVHKNITAYYIETSKNSENRIPDDLLILLKKLPDKEYQTTTELEEEIYKIFNDKEFENSVKLIRDARNMGKTVVWVVFEKGKLLEPQPRDLERPQQPPIQTDEKAIENLWREPDKSDVSLPPMSSNRMLVSFWLFIKNIADGHNINTKEAARLIANDQNLLDEFVNELGIKNVNDVTNMLKSITDKDPKTMKTLATGFAEKYEEEKPQT